MLSLQVTRVPRGLALLHKARESRALMNLNSCGTHRDTGTHCDTGTRRVPPRADPVPCSLQLRPFFTATASSFQRGHSAHGLTRPTPFTQDQCSHSHACPVPPAPLLTDGLCLSLRPCPSPCRKPHRCGARAASLPLPCPAPAAAGILPAGTALLCTPVTGASRRGAALGSGTTGSPPPPQAARRVPPSSARCRSPAEPLADGRGDPSAPGAVWGRGLSAPDAHRSGDAVGARGRPRALRAPGARPARGRWSLPDGRVPSSGSRDVTRRPPREPGRGFHPLFAPVSLLHSAEKGQRGRGARDGD